MGSGSQKGANLRKYESCYHESGPRIGSMIHTMKAICRKALGGCRHEGVAR
jgi:hypothetical protein